MGGWGGGSRGGAGGGWARPSAPNARGWVDSSQNKLAGGVGAFVREAGGVEGARGRQAAAGPNCAPPLGPRAGAGAPRSPRDTRRSASQGGLAVGKVVGRGQRGALMARRSALCYSWVGGQAAGEGPPVVEHDRQGQQDLRARVGVGGAAAPEWEGWVGSLCRLGCNPNGRGQPQPQAAAPTPAATAGVGNPNPRPSPKQLRQQPAWAAPPPTARPRSHGTHLPSASCRRSSTRQAAVRRMAALAADADASRVSVPTHQNLWVQMPPGPSPPAPSFHPPVLAVHELQPAHQLAFGHGGGLAHHGGRHAQLVLQGGVRGEGGGHQSWPWGRPCASWRQARAAGTAGRGVGGQEGTRDIN